MLAVFAHGCVSLWNTAKSAEAMELHIMKETVALSALFLATLMASGCALALPGYNDPFTEKVLVLAPEPSRLVVLIEGSGQEGVPVPEDGRLVLEFPVLPMKGYKIDTDTYIEVSKDEISFTSFAMVAW